MRIPGLAVVLLSAALAVLSSTDRLRPPRADEQVPGSPPVAVAPQRILLPSGASDSFLPASRREGLEAQPTQDAGLQIVMPMQFVATQPSEFSFPLPANVAPQFGFVADDVLVQAFYSTGSLPSDPQLSAAVPVTISQHGGPTATFLPGHYELRTGLHFRGDAPIVIHADGPEPSTVPLEVSVNLIGESCSARVANESLHLSGNRVSTVAQVGVITATANPGKGFVVTDIVTIVAYRQDRSWVYFVPEAEQVTVSQDSGPTLYVGPSFGTLQQFRPGLDYVDQPFSCHSSFRRGVEFNANPIEVSGELHTNKAGAAGTALLYVTLIGYERDATVRASSAVPPTTR